VSGPAKKFWPRLLVSLFSLLAALAVAEVGLRIAFRGDSPAEVREKLLRSERASLNEANGQFSLIGLVRPSPFADIIYELKPSLSGTFRNRPLHINSLGLRGREVERAKPSGVFRIVGLGDSVMFGWGVGEGEPYLQIVEQRLNEKALRRFEVLNFAVPGYNAAIEAATFEHKAAAFAPDLVVVHFIGNDFGPPHFLRPPGPASAAEGEKVPSYLWVLAAGLLRRDEPADSPELFHDLRQLPQEVRHETRARLEPTLGEDGYRRAMDRLGRLARRQGVPVLLLSLGDGNERGRIARETADANGFRYVNAGPRFYAYLAERGLASEKSNWVTTFRIPNDGHPNALGHALYADVLLAELEAMGVTGRRAETVPGPQS
jgi:lysophospholipase L1-like esterase